MTDGKQQHIITRFYFWGKVFFVAFLLIGIWNFLFVDRAIVELTAETNVKSLFKIYYRTVDGNWSERKMHEASLHPGKRSYSFRLADRKRIAELRIDPSEKKSKVTVYSLKLKQYGYPPLDIVQLAKEGKIRCGDGIADFHVGKKGFTVTANSNDPNLFLKMPDPLKNKGKLAYIAQLLLLVVLASFLVKASERVLFQYRYIAWAMLLVVTLVAVMAGISSYNTHPDEKIHTVAARFYEQNTIPPAVGDPRAEGTYSSYGFSRLYSGEIAYFFAGKFAKLLEPLDLPDYIAFRYFNVTLLVVLFSFASVNTTWRIILIPFLLSPQIWYIFSYWNSEGLALFLMFCSVWQLVAKESAWNRLVSGKPVSQNLPGLLWVILLLTLLFFCKLNFYFFLLFAGLFVLHQILFKKITLNWHVTVTVGSILLCAVALFGSYRLWNASINDFETESRIQEQVILHAKPLFNPATPFEKQFHNIHMKQRGVTFEEMLSTRWGERSFRSAVGEYGYTSVPSPFNYYHYMRYTLMLLGIAAAVSILLRGGWENSTLLILTAGTGITLIAISFYHSWTMDYQAQGRYLLPIIGMISTLVYQARKQLENIIVLSVATLLFCGSLYSFIFVALAGIGKVATPF